MKKYTNDPIINEVIHDHIKRHKQGMKQFKKTMHKNNKPMLEWIVDLKEELIDALVYLKKIENLVKQGKLLPIKPPEDNAHAFFQFLRGKGKGK
jgi:hypothetical protein